MLNGYSRTMVGLFSASLLALGFAAISPVTAQSDDDIRIVILSSRAGTISGGDTLVRLESSNGRSLTGLAVTLNGTNVTGLFRPVPAGNGLLGLLTGLVDGDNALAVARGGTEAARATLVNHPITGPVIAGPHEEPFMCETEQFDLLSGGTLGPALDDNCSVETRIDYLYRSTEGGDLKPLPSPTTLPADLARTETMLGAEVPYIVRMETGTINRAIYQIAMLHDPQNEREPEPWITPRGWNNRLIFTFGGGCMYGWYRQGSTTGIMDDDAMLRQGYAVASSSLNVFGNNCNDLLAAETMMMVKERVIEILGPPKLTIGWGCSGGSYQNHQIADNYPGLLDGIMPGCSFPDVIVGMIPYLADSRSLNSYFKATDLAWTDDQKKAVVGFVTLYNMIRNDEQYAGRIAVSELCPDALPEVMQYDRTGNPKGARCGAFDHAVNALGINPQTGYANRPLDNVGVQYGLKALRNGAISKEQFIDLNETIGGYDSDGNIAPQRAVADLEGIRAAYRTGRITAGTGGLATTPIIDYRAYGDDLPEGDVHTRYHSYSMRERLLKANGHADNHIMITEDHRFGGYSSTSPVLRNALSQMDQWLTALTEDASDDPQIEKVRRAKPASLVDACWTRGDNPLKIVEPQIRSGRCEELYPSASFPREVAGGPITADIVKCQLKPIDQADYGVSFAAEEMVRLQQAFPTGVCDWSKPSIEHQELAGTWLRFGPPGTFSPIE
jgi:hypothetical protein